MSVREVTMYQIVCDEPGCDFKTGDGGNSEYIAWADRGQAEDGWMDDDGQNTREGKHFCWEHRKPACEDCSTTVNVVNDSPDGSGDWWCPEHSETLPEYEAPGVVS